MKKILSIILCAVIMLAIIPSAVLADSVGTTYYIDAENGDDANSGTNKNEAWKSVANISSLKLGVGDEILFKRDQTHECTNLTITAVSTPDNPILISSYGDGKNARLNTNEKADILRLFDCSYVTVSELEMTAHNGGGIWIDTPNKASCGIRIENLEMHDMQNYKVTSRDNFSDGASAARACIMVKGLGGKHEGNPRAVDNLTVIGCEMYNVGNGVILWGSWNNEKDPWRKDYEDECEYYYNKGTLVKDCYMHDMDAEAVVVGICDGALVTRCRIINCCQGEGVDENGKAAYATAAAWFWGSVNSTISYSEIAGQKNLWDGMTVDFDSYSNNCTYEYIYSHDNTRFMCNNSIRSGQYGNTVRYCLSVNDYNPDDQTSFGNRVASGCEYNFNFYNNTIVGCGDFKFTDIYDSVIANNIFIPVDGAHLIFDVADNIKAGNRIKNNCYYNIANPTIDLFSKNVNPGFVGTDYSNPESFKLAKNSPLIGAGYDVVDAESDDFFGNKITSLNIGCYGGDGEDAEYEKENLIERIFRLIRYFFKLVIVSITRDK